MYLWSEMLFRDNFQEHHIVALRFSSRGKAVHVGILQEVNWTESVLLTFLLFFFFVHTCKKHCSCCASYELCKPSRSPQLPPLPGATSHPFWTLSARQLHYHLDHFSHPSQFYMNAYILRIEKINCKKT